MRDLEYCQLIDKLLETIEDDKNQTRYILDYDLKKLLKATFEPEINSAYNAGYNAAMEDQ